MTPYANIGFVGCGSHSTNNLYPMLKYSRCRLQAVCDMKEELARRNARVFGGRSVYTSVDEMLAKEKLDGVMVCGSPQMHLEVARKVLARGIPVFVEKPPAPSLAGAQELADLANANKTFLMTGFMKRHALAYARIRRFIQEGRFEPAAGVVRYTHWAGGDLEGMLMGMSIHPIDLAISFFGDPVEIQAMMHKPAWGLSLGVNMRFASGQFVQLVLGDACRIQEHVEITGKLGDKSAMFVVDNIQHLELHSQGRNGIDLVNFTKDGCVVPELCEIDPQFDLEDIQIWRPDYGIPNMSQNSPFFCGYAGEVREFADAILQNRQPYPGTADAVKAMRVIDALLKKPDGVTKL